MRDTLSAAEFLLLKGLKKSLSHLSAAAKRKIFQKIPAGYQCIAVHAGAVHAVHTKIIHKSYQQYEVKVKKQADILAVGIPYVCPYSVNSILNPLLVQVMALGYIYHLFTGGRPLVREGGSLIIFHPCRDEFDERFHPSYVEFFHRLLPESTDSRFLQKEYERNFAEDPDYIRLYREDHAYHGVHPFYMWYWGESGRRRLGKIIVVGAEHPYVPERMGWHNANNFQEALQLAGYQNPTHADSATDTASAGVAMAADADTQGSQLTLLHLPPMLMTRIIAY